MTKFEQFRTLLADLDIEAKDTLIGAFDEAIAENSNIKNDIVKQRDELKADRKNLLDQLDTVKGTLGLDELNEDSLSGILKGKKGESELREELSKKYEEKYNSDIQKLTEQINELTNQNGEITNKYNDTLFKNAVVNSGLLDSFVDDKDARDSIIIPRIKDKLLFKDGQVFVKDETTGDIATKLGTNEPLSPNDVIESLKTTISPIYLKAQSQGQGMGTNPQQSRQSNIPTKRSEMNHSQKAQYIKDNGEDAYLKLPN